MGKKTSVFTGSLLGFILLFQINAYANSSWHWVTTSPKTIFPIAVAVTLLIEYVALIKIARLECKLKVLLVVCFANLLSFAAPYIYRAIRFRAVLGTISISAAFNKGPYFMVMTEYLLLTLLVELPVVYLLLKNRAQNKLRLAITILSANIITTGLVAVLERLICVGQW